MCLGVEYEERVASPLRPIRFARCCCSERRINRLLSDELEGGRVQSAR